MPDRAEPAPFQEPWEAQAFAMAVALQDRGLFTAEEWAQALGAEIRRAQNAGDPDRGDSYYAHWLAALERLVVEKSAASGERLSDLRAAWDHAARSTPHGQPIVLPPDS